MNSEIIQRVLVWPPIIRVLHLLMAATVIILMITGWLLHSGMILNDRLYEHLLQVWHLPAGNVLIVTLSVRLLLLLFRKDVAGWRALIPENVNSVIGVATFYLSMARMTLPGYFAHNPLWKFLYIIWFVILLMASFSGLLLESAWLRSVFRTDTSTMLYQHALLLGPISAFVIGHIITALLHDWKSQTGELSAIINGHKYFTVEQKPANPIATQQVSINIDSLTKTPNKK